MFSMICAAAPGWPSAAFIIALLERRLSTMSSPSRASMMPIGSHSQPQAITARTVSASGMSTAAAASGANHLSRLAVNEKTIPICFSRWPNETFSCGALPCEEV